MTSPSNLGRIWPSKKLLKIIAVLGREQMNRVNRFPQLCARACRDVASGRRTLKTRTAGTAHRNRGGAQADSTEDVHNARTATTNWSQVNRMPSATWGGSMSARCIAGGPGPPQVSALGDVVECWPASPVEIAPGAGPVVRGASLTMHQPTAHRLGRVGRGHHDRLSA